MQLTHWDPWGEVSFFPFDVPLVSYPKFGWDMAVDMFEENGNLVTMMNLPEVPRENIEISIKNDLLKISGSRDDRKEKKSQDYYYKERGVGSFVRIIKISRSIDVSKVKATLSSGLLRISMPITEGPIGKSYKIEVQ